ncbi:transporter substrate-binding domain-containing protein [Kiloniella laminariae]|uniref:Transporter substrate-binding domain-containing protein n=1 Tax=Kiloniella laminariae TaxID=454162 RepID=A0ABT4LGJ7_9PROT|nr:transporter substrate-binding domain-containing protein [Kiloniella laminariae]MCZ4280065.1 transporter substrate-binding domain-containing protein [Kiloniella laminariae]
MILRFASSLVLAMLLSLTAQAEPLIMACNSWKPLIDEARKDTGLLSEIITLSGERVDLQVQHLVLPWNRVIAGVKKGEIDGISCLTYAAENKNWITYTNQAFWEIEIGIFVRRDSGIKLGQLKDLQEYSFGSLKGSSYFEILQGLIGEDIRISPYPKEIDGMKMLIEKRFEVLFTGRMMGHQLLQSQHLERSDEVTYLETLYLDHIHPGISRIRPDAQDIAQRLDKGFQMIKADGTLEQLYEKHGHFPPSRKPLNAVTN